jgi:hypothetical protein
MLGGYVIALYAGKLRNSEKKVPWIYLGVVTLAVMVGLSWHVVFGIKKSPHSGMSYGERRRGYVQRYEMIRRSVKENLRGSWQYVGEYIREHSQPDDKMYVWGWYPGMYVEAQRFSPTPQCCVLARTSPETMEKMVEGILSYLKAEPPKFIVDSRKRHLPMDRPPLELWPIVPNDFLAGRRGHFLQPQEKQAFDRKWKALLREQFDEEEVRLYEAVEPLRDFVMSHYRVVNTRSERLMRMFGQHVVFERKTD